MLKMIIGRLLPAAVIVACGLAIADAGPVFGEQMADRSPLKGDHVMPAHDLFDRVIEMTGGAANEDELRQWLENDPLVQEAGIDPDSDIMISGVYTGDCYLTPLICLFETHTPELSCVYNCVGMRGSGEVIRRHVEECDFLVGCILFENCLTLCITIIPHNFPSVIR